MLAGGDSSLVSRDNKASWEVHRTPWNTAKQTNHEANRHDQQFCQRWHVNLPAHYEFTRNHLITYATNQKKYWLPKDGHESANNWSLQVSSFFPRPFSSPLNPPHFSYAPSYLHRKIETRRHQQKSLVATDDSPRKCTMLRSKKFESFQEIYKQELFSEREESKFSDNEGFDEDVRKYWTNSFLPPNSIFLSGNNHRFQ